MDPGTDTPVLVTDQAIMMDPATAVDLAMDQDMVDLPTLADPDTDQSIMDPPTDQVTTLADPDTDTATAADPATAVDPGTDLAIAADPGTDPDTDPATAADPDTVTATADTADMVDMVDMADTVDMANTDPEMRLITYHMTMCLLSSSLPITISETRITPMILNTILKKSMNTSTTITTIYTVIFQRTTISMTIIITTRPFLRHTSTMGTIPKLTKV